MISRLFGRIGRETLRAIYVAAFVIAIAGTGVVVASGISNSSSSSAFPFTGDASIVGPLGVSGAVAITGATTIKGAVGISGSLAVTGPTQLNGAVAATGGAVTINAFTTSSTGLTVTGGNASGVHGIKGTGANATTSAGVMGTGSGSDGKGIWGQAMNVGTGSGYAVFAESNSGIYSLGLACDTTSPVKACVSITPQNADPTAAAVGDVYVYTGGIPRAAIATTPVFVSISNLGTKSTVAAAGNNQATATAMAATADWVTVTGVDGTKGITLPSGSVQACVRVMSQDVTNVLFVYGHNSDNDTINGAAADASYTHAIGTSLVYCTADGTAWFTY